MSIPTLRRGDNGFFYAFWSEGRRSKRETMGTKEEAEATRRFAQWLMIEGQRDSTLPSPPLSELWGLYREKHVVASPGTLDMAWKNLGPHFGALPPQQVNSDTVAEYVRKREAGRIGRKAVAATVRRELVALRACLNWCADPKRRLIDPAAVQKFDLPAGSQPRDRWLKTDEIQRLMDGAKALRRGEKLARVEIFLWLALETAARMQAILDLTWDRVDFETKVIHYNVPGRAETSKRRADVPISAALLPVLERAYAERDKKNPLVLGNKGAMWASVQWAAINAGFSDQKVKNSEKPKATGISPHVLRHTAATHMARRGVPLWKIAKILGNSLLMVEKVYAKHCPDDLREAVDQISRGSLEAVQ